MDKYFSLCCLNSPRISLYGHRPGGGGVHPHSHTSIIGSKQSCKPDSFAGHIYIPHFVEQGVASENCSMLEPCYPAAITLY